MSVYSLTLPSIKKTFLSKGFTVQDCLDINFLINNEDKIGLDLYIQKKFLEYTDLDNELLAIDKFAYLFTQKIMSHDPVLKLKSGENDSISVNLVQIYNDLMEKDFIKEQEITINNIKLVYGLPKSLNSDKSIQLYSVNGTKVEEDILDSLPAKIIKTISGFITKNNELINQSYYYDVFKSKFSLKNSEYFSFIKLLFTENIASLFHTLFILNKEYNLDIDFIRNFTQRDLYLYVLTVNKYVKDKEQQQKTKKFQ